MAKPRVFISSTYYDLKYLRTSFENFIESLGFEPILFEKGDIAYSHDKPMDVSCNNEVRNSDILVLIIGGQYGSKSSIGENKPSNDFHTEYISITREEFKTAIENEIPTYILIEKSVFCDYETYLKNKDNPNVNYAHVNSTSIFNFIEEILALPQNNPYYRFDHYPEIEIWLKKQWAGKFRELLKTIPEKQQLMKLSSQVLALGEINDSMRRYIEQVVTKFIPEQSEELIKEENKRIQSFNIINHISDLKDMVRLWQQHLRSNKVAPVDETFTFGRLNPFVPSSRAIENHVLFEDIFHHFPDLRDFWNESKILSHTYSLERQEFFNKIEEHIKQKLKEHNFHYQSENYNFDIESIVKGFILSVYIEIVRITKGKNKIHDYSTQQVSVKGVVTNQLIYGVIGSGSGYILAYIGSERMDEVKNIHKEMIKECEEIYLSDIKKIIELENKTRDSQNKLESKLDEIIYLMVFDHMDCKFVKLI